MADLNATLRFYDQLSPGLQNATRKTETLAARMTKAFNGAYRTVFSLKSAMVALGGAMIVRSFMATAAASDKFKDRVAALTKQWEDFKISILKAGVFDWIEGALKSMIAYFGDSKAAVKATADTMVTGLSIVAQVVGSLATGVQMVYQGFKWLEAGVQYVILGLQKLSQTVANWAADAMDAFAWFIDGFLGEGKTREMTDSLRIGVSIAAEQSKEQEKIAKRAYEVADGLSAQKLIHETIFDEVERLNIAYEEGKKILDGQALAAGKISAAWTHERFRDQPFAWSEPEGEGMVGEGWIGTADAQKYKNEAIAKQIAKQKEAAGEFLSQAVSTAAQEAIEKQEAIDALESQKKLEALNAQNAALERQKDLYDQIHDKVSSVINIIGNAFMNYMDDLVEGKVKPMRDYFKDMLKDFARWLMQMAMQRAATAVSGAIVSVAGGVGAAAGGIAGAAGGGGILPSPYASMPVRAYATGGITPHVTNGPELWMVGERNQGRAREAVIPLEGNRSVPVVMKGGGGSVTNNYYSISATDSASFEEYLTTNRRAVRIANNRNLREHPGSRA